MIQKEKVKNNEQLNYYAQILMKDLPRYEQVEPDETSYVGTCASLVLKEIRYFYQSAEVKSPKLNAVKRWFYTNSCPDWAIAVLHSRIQERKLLQKV